MIALNTNIIYFQSCKDRHSKYTILNIITANKQDIVSMEPFPEGISYNFDWMIQ